MTLELKYFAVDAHNDIGCYQDQAQTFEECYSSMVRGAQEYFYVVNLEMFRDVFKGRPGFIAWDDAVICIREITLSVDLTTRKQLFSDTEVPKINVDRIWKKLVSRYPYLHAADDGECE